MKRKDATFAFALVLLCIVVSSAVGTGSWIFWEAWQGSDREVFKALIGGFAGAFFAFLFVRIGETLKRLGDRYERDHVALMRIQHYLNDSLGVMNDNRFVAEDFLELMTDARLIPEKEDEAPPVYMNRFHEFAIDSDVLIDLSNIDLVNEIYSFNGSVRKTNASLVTINRAMDTMTSAYMSKPREFAFIYVANMKQTRKTMAEMKVFLDEVIEDAIRSLATAQLLVEEPPFSVRLVRRLTRQAYSSRFREELPAKEVEVRKGIEEVQRKSQAKIEETLQKIGASSQSKK